MDPTTPTPEQCQLVGTQFSASCHKRCVTYSNHEAMKIKGATRRCVRVSKEYGFHLQTPCAIAHRRGRARQFGGIGQKACEPTWGVGFCFSSSPIPVGTGISKSSSVVSTGVCHVVQIIEHQSVGVNCILRLGGWWMMMGWRVMGGTRLGSDGSSRPSACFGGGGRIGVDDGKYAGTSVLRIP